MTQEKHTPGPWHFYTDPQPNGCPIVGNNNGLMVAMIAHSVNYNAQKEMAIANARLIAASPTMFDYIIARSALGDAEASEILESINAAR